MKGVTDTILDLRFWGNFKMLREEILSCLPRTKKYGKIEV